MAVDSEPISGDLPPCDVLREILATATVVDGEGVRRKLSSAIAPQYAAALYRAVVRFQPALVIEIGMAQGISTLSILAGLSQNGKGRLVSIDPGQRREWRNVGVENVRRAGFAALHELMEMPSHEALPRLLASGTRADMAYIDGWHTFDYVLVDFFFLDKMLPVGGVVGFNDCGYRAIHRVIRFVETHRRYRELDVGLAPCYAARNLLRSLARRWLRFSRQDRYFQKSEAWEPAWNFYARF